MVLFVLTRVLAVEQAVMSGYALVFLYMVVPLEGLLLAIPSVSRTRVALERVHQGTAGLEHREAPADEPEGDGDRPARFDSLRLAGVTHSYRREPAATRSCS